MAADHRPTGRSGDRWSQRVDAFLALLVASCGFVIVLDSFAANVAFPRLLEAFPDTPRSGDVD